MSATSFSFNEAGALFHCALKKYRVLKCSQADSRLEGESSADLATVAFRKGILYVGDSDATAILFGASSRRDVLGIVVTPSRCRRSADISPPVRHARRRLDCGCSTYSVNLTCCRYRRRGILPRPQKRPIRLVRKIVRHVLAVFRC